MIEAIGSAKAQSFAGSKSSEISFRSLLSFVVLHSIEDGCAVQMETPNAPNDRAML